MKKQLIRNLVAVLAMASSASCALAQTATFSYFKYEGNDARFHQKYDTAKEYLNPILAGFYPDPSICRVGDTYYLVNSSFSFFPGVPLSVSNDLVHWTSAGHVLDRPSQLPLARQNVSGGIFAPDIKYNAKNKTFYMVTTNVGAGNFYVKTKDPKAGWSEMIRLPQVDGIDPSFCFDGDKAYIVHNGPVEGGADYEGQRAIRILKFDVKGDSVITKGTPDGRGWWQIVRGGTHVEKQPIWIEGPHLYRIGKYYYLMCAEGGTGDWHSEVIFRASAKSDITKAESWEECPNNPILTQRDIYDYKANPYLPDDAVTSTGHADLVQTPQGDWYAVFLGCRAYEGPYYNTGRDTYLLPVTWKDGWPTILEKGKKLPTVVSYASLKNKEKGIKNKLAGTDGNLYSNHKPQTSTLNPQNFGQAPYSGNFAYTDNFDGQTLNQRWMFLRNPSSFYSISDKGLTITPKPVNVSQKESPSAVFCRQQHTDFTAETSLNFQPKTDKDLAGLVLLQNENYNFVFGITVVAGKPVITLTRSEKTPVVIASTPLTDVSAPVRLKIEGKGRYYSFFYALQGGDWQVLARGVDAVNLSTSRSGGFIGACIGLYATSAGVAM